MSDILSQAEIDALLNGSGDNSSGGNSYFDVLSDEQRDALGEIANISMGTSATTLFTLLGRKVTITTPRVTVTDWDELAREFNNPNVAVQIEFTTGLQGLNLLIIKEQDVKIITDLMMGGDGQGVAGDLTDLHLSAIGEAMNQMIGSAATSMSSVFNKRIDISPPTAFMISFANDNPFGSRQIDNRIVRISFNMVVENLIDSEIMQLLPIGFAGELADNLLRQNNSQVYEEETLSKPKVSIPQTPAYTPPQQHFSAPAAPEVIQPPQMQYYNMQAPAPQSTTTYNGPVEQDPPRNQVNVQHVQFETFDDNRISAERENINLIMDVPLEITVELGRTQRLIRDVLEFVPGSIVELDKLAGEPIDILVNGKVIAKGEVVVIDESFGVRLTDIVSPSKRL